MTNTHTNTSSVPTYMSISDAARESGISKYMIRSMVKKNEIPHIMSRAKYLVNYPKMLTVFETLEIVA